LPTFKVRPCLPEALDPLLGIAYNLRWSWDHAAIDLFRRFDRQLWEEAGRNPVRLQGTIDQWLLESAAKDESFLTHLKGVSEKFEYYLAARGRDTRGSLERTTTCWLPTFRPSLALRSACPSLRVD
jgi:glucan phosphorylase